MDNIEASKMATAISSRAARRVEFAFYEISKSGQTIEIFFADRVFARSFGARAAGWYWRYRQADCSPGKPTGPFLVCLDAYRDALRPLTPAI
jgi:hypothetical protein